MYGIYNFKLGNGLEVLFIKKKINRILIKARIKYGYFFENNKNIGLAHLLEHCLKFGTKNFKDEDSLDRHIEMLGGDYSLTTTDYFIDFDLELPRNKLKEGLNIIKEVIFYPRFGNDKIFKKEKGVILEELTKSSTIYSLLAFVERQAIFKKETPLVKSMDYKTQIRSLKTLSRSAIIMAWKKYFVPNNIYLGILGDCNLKTIKYLTRKVFGPLKAKSVVTGYTIPQGWLSKESIVIGNSKTAGGVIFVSLFIPLKIINLKHRLILSLIIRYLNRRTNEILKKARKEGFLYDIVFTYTLFGNNFWFLSIRFQTRKKQNVSKILNIIKNFFNKVLKKLSMEELNFLKKDLLFEYEKLNEKSEDLFDYLMDIFTLEKFLFSLNDLKNILKTISMNDLKKFIKENIIFTETRLSLFSNSKINEATAKKILLLIKKGDES